MQDWHSTCLGRRTLPRDLSAFEIEAFFNFSNAERGVIEERRSAALKLALAPQIGFLRHSPAKLGSPKLLSPSGKLGIDPLNGLRTDSFKGLAGTRAQLVQIKGGEPAFFELAALLHFVANPPPLGRLILR